MRDSYIEKFYDEFQNRVAALESYSYTNNTKIREFEEAIEEAMEIFARYAEVQSLREQVNVLQGLIEEQEEKIQAVKQKCFSLTFEELMEV